MACIVAKSPSKRATHAHKSLSPKSVIRYPKNFFTAQNGFFITIFHQSRYPTYFLIFGYLTRPSLHRQTVLLSLILFQLPAQSRASGTVAKPAPLNSTDEHQAALAQNSKKYSVPKK